MTEPCPNCDAPIQVDDDVELSEVLVCAACDAEVEVVALDPVRLAPFEEEEK